MEAIGTVIEARTVRMERLLPGSLETVWAYLTESEKRRLWLASGEMDLRPGGAVELHFLHAELSPHKVATPERFKQYENGHVMRGQVLDCDPPRRLRFTWGDRPDPSEVLFELTPQEDAVLLRITHSRLPGRGDMIGVSSGWQAHTEILSERLHGRVPPAIWPLFDLLEPQYRQLVPEDAE